jgi:hypothetical protein
MHALFLYPGDRRSVEFRRLLEDRHPLHGTKMKQAAVRALVNLTDGFYRRVYPPEREKENEPFDFGEEAFLRDYMREAAQLFRAKGTRPEYVFMVRAEVVCTRPCTVCGRACRPARSYASFCDGRTHSLAACTPFVLVDGWPVNFSHSETKLNVYSAGLCLETGIVESDPRDHLHRPRHL